MEQKPNKQKKRLFRLPVDRQEAERKRIHAMMGALKAIHSAASPDSMEPADLERQRKGQELLGRLAAPMLGMSWEPFQIDGMPAAWVRPERGHDKRHVILYCHGGGYTSGNLGYARILGAKLANATGYEVLVFEYRLAPEHPFPAPLEDAQRAWDYLMHWAAGPGTWWWPETPPAAIWPWCSPCASGRRTAACPAGWSSSPPGPT